MFGSELLFTWLCNGLTVVLAGRETFGHKSRDRLVFVVGVVIPIFVVLCDVLCPMPLGLSRNRQT